MRESEETPTRTSTSLPCTLELPLVLEEFSSQNRPSAGYKPGPARFSIHIPAANVKIVNKADREGSLSLQQSKSFRLTLGVTKATLNLFHSIVSQKRLSSGKTVLRPIDRPPVLVFGPPTGFKPEAPKKDSILPQRSNNRRKSGELARNSDAKKKRKIIQWL